MRVKVQLVICADDERTDTIHDVAVLEKDCQQLEQLGLTLTEAKQLLAQLQQHVVAHQASVFVTMRSHCKVCGTPLQRKEETTRLLRTLFGTVRLPSPRLYHCRCQTGTTTTFRPLTELLSTSMTPELLFLETKWASLISYRMTARVLKDFLPLDETLNATTIQNHTLAVAQRCEDELDEDQDGVADSSRADGGPLSLPKGPFAVGLDGGYVRDWDQKQQHFEVIVGKAVPADQPAKCFGFVQTYDTKAKQRLQAVLQSQGVQDTQPLTFLSDGGETVRNLPVRLYPQAAHWIDWFHLTMRVTLLGQYLKGLSRLNQEVGEGIQKTLESVKWLLWHGQVTKALDRLRDFDRRIEHFVDTYPRFTQLKKAVQQFHTYIVNNRACIPNYGQRYRRGETISTAFVESTVNSVLSKRFVKKQSMQWTKRGAHLLLQTRVKTLNNELAATFRRWYPDFQVEETAPLAA
jgi:hypothetical protein